MYELIPATERLRKIPSAVSMAGFLFVPAVGENFFFYIAHL